MFHYSTISGNISTKIVRLLHDDIERPLKDVRGGMCNVNYFDVLGLTTFKDLFIFLIQSLRAYGTHGPVTAGIRSEGARAVLSRRLPPLTNVYGKI